MGYEGALVRILFIRPGTDKRACHAGFRWPLRRRGLVALLALALAAACGVNGREDLVGRYETSGDGPGETWTLATDGTCTIVRRRGGATPPETTRCEWEYVHRGGRASLMLTVLPPEGATRTRHRARYVLTPSRFPGGSVTIPLGAGSDRQLRKVE